MSGFVTISVAGSHRKLSPGDTLIVDGKELLTVTSVDTGHDPVKRPPHYTQQVPGVECKEVAGHFSFNAGSAIKYLWRHQSKGRPVEDLRKAIEFIQFEIERLERIEDGSSTIDGYTPEDED